MVEPRDDRGLNVDRSEAGKLSAQQQQELDGISHSLWEGVSEQSNVTNSMSGVSVLVGVVTTVHSDKKVSIRRPENLAADGKQYPVIAPGYHPVVGDWIVGIELDGGGYIFGRRTTSTDRDIPDLASKKFERDGSQSIDMNTQSVTIYRNAGNEMITLRDAGANGARYRYMGFYRQDGTRVGYIGVNPSNNLELGTDSLGTRVQAIKEIYAPDFVVEGVRRFSNHEHDHRYWEWQTSDNRYAYKSHNDSHDGRYAWWSHNHNDLYWLATTSDNRYAYKSHAHPYQAAGVLVDHWHYESTGTSWTGNARYY